MRLAFVFPGQGSQTVGMGKDIFEQFPAAKQVFASADAAVGFSLSSVCFEGPEETLKDTVHAQPAITAVSLAYLAAFLSEAGAGADAVFTGIPEQFRPIVTAGHSVGEYTAFIAAGAISFQDGLRLVYRRGQLMSQDSKSCPSGMAAVLGLSRDALTEICRQAEAAVAQNTDTLKYASVNTGSGAVRVANDNAPGQIVISGAMPALEKAMELAQAAGAKRVVPLAVSGAFHSPVMADAAQKFTEFAASVQIHDAHTPIISNCEAEPMYLAAEIRKEAERQIVSSVLWTQTVEWMAGQGQADTFVEFGAGQVLGGLIKRTVKNCAIYSVGTAQDVVRVAAALREQGYGFAAQ